MTRTYIDTSAFIRRLIGDAPGHAAIAALLAAPDRRLVSSEILWLEAARTGLRLARENPSLENLPSAIDRALAAVELVALDRTILAVARNLPEIVKSLDAIHIATVLTLGDSLDDVLTCDARMGGILGARGFTVVDVSTSP